MPTLPTLPAWQAPVSGAVSAAPPVSVATATPTLGAIRQPTVVNYPTAAQQTALNQQNLPGAWGNWFASTFGPLATYYTPERGGPTQAQWDYRNWQSLFSQLFGRPPTPDDFAEIFDAYRQQALTTGTPATLAGFFAWMQRTYGQMPRPPMTSYVRVSAL